MLSEVFTRRILGSLMLAVAITSLLNTGCSQPIRRLGILDEIAIAYRDQVWARRAYNLRFANCNRDYEEHFRNGFCSGYSDVCNGGDGYVPALPPDQYRGFEFQCAEGANCVDAWFGGYPAGVAAAREENAGKYHEVQISSMIDRAVTQTNAPNKLPADVPVTKPTQNMYRPTNQAASKTLGPKPRIVPAMSALPSVAENVYSANQSVSSVAKSGANRLAPSRVAPPNPVQTRVAKSTIPLKPKKVNTAKPPIVQPVKKPSVTKPKILVPATTSASNLPKIIVPHSVAKQAPQSIPAAPMNPASALLPSTANPFVPPIVSGASKANVKSKPPIVTPVQPVSHGGEFPPIYSGKKMDTSARALLPPIIRGRKIDPSATVTESETSAPLYQSSRSARRPSRSTNR